MQKIAWTGLLFILVLTFSFQIPALAQSKKYFVISGKIEPEVTDSNTGSIEVLKNDSEKTIVNIPKNGRFRLELDFFNEYSLTFKYPGHFNKIILVSTQIPQEVWERDNDFPAFPMIVQLLKEYEGIDKSFTLKPLGKIFYGKEIDNFVTESYISDIQFLEQINTAKNEASKAKKEEQSISKENAQDLAARQKSYDQAIKEADTNYQRADYQAALQKYQDALKLFPDRAYPKDRVSELQDLVKALEITERQKAELEQKFRAAIAKGDESFTAKAYPDALTAYQEALQYKPGDTYAGNRINETNNLLAQLAKQKQYDDLIANADKNYQSKAWDQAVAQYTQALQLLPNEKYPQDQLNKIAAERRELAKQEQTDRDFNQAMQAASSAAQKKDYTQALTLYKKAQEMKPNDSLVQVKITEVNQAMVAIENEKKYLQAIQLADQALAAKDLEKAKAQYEEAIKYKSAETYPKSKLAEISAAEANELKFQSLLSQGEKNFGDGKFDEALSNFNEALTIKPQNETAKKRIADIENLKKQQQTDRDYAALIAQADGLFNQSDLAKATETYNKALQLRKSETYPKEQIQKIASYQAAVKKADKLFGSKDYNGAKTAYNEALAAKASDSYASGKITEIDRILSEKQAQDEKAKNDLLAYTEAVKIADNLFAAKNYNESLTKYQEASKIKPSESYPPKRIKEIESILGAQAKEKDRTDSEYQSAISQADKAFEAKDYENSKQLYNKALGVKPAEAYPKDQIRKIDEAIAEIRRQDQEKLDRAYNEAMTSGDNALAASDFSTAINGYQKALTVKPNDKAAKDKLDNARSKVTETNRLTESYNKAIDQANALATAKKYAEAKAKYQEALQYRPEQEYPKTQIAKIDEVLAQREAEAKTRRDYDQAVAEGEKSLRAKDYLKAKDAYTQAYNLIPSEPVPPQKISEINSILAEQNRKASELNAVAESYKAAIQKADKYFAEKDYTTAKLAYDEALLIKDDEKYPADQLDLIAKLLVEQTDLKYKEAILNADNLLASDRLDESAGFYQEALKYKKNDPYALSKLKEIDQRKKNLAAEAERLRKLEEQYNKAIAAADADFANKAYPSAKSGYQKALTFKPNESYPKEKISEIDNLMTEQERIAELNRQFAQVMRQAQTAFDQKKLKEARDLYLKARDLKPEEPVPPAKIAEIDQILARQEEEATRKALAAAQQPAPEPVRNVVTPPVQEVRKPVESPQPAPVKPRTQVVQTTDLYAGYIETGDKSFDKKEYVTARFNYSKASEIKPEEEYPKKQIETIRGIFDSQLSAAELALYNDAISQADKALSGKNYAVAKFYYGKALGIKSWEEYPKTKLDELQKVADQEQQEKNDQEYRKIIEAADQAWKAENYATARFNYNRAAAMRPNDEYPKNQLQLIREALDKKKN